MAQWGLNYRISTHTTDCANDCCVMYEPTKKWALDTAKEQLAALRQLEPKPQEGAVFVDRWNHKRQEWQGYKVLWQ